MKVIVDHLCSNPDPAHYILFLARNSFVSKNVWGMNFRIRLHLCAKILIIIVLGVHNIFYSYF